MKLNKSLKIEGIIAIILLVCMSTGLYLWYHATRPLSSISGIFIIITSSPAFVFITIIAVIYWVCAFIYYQIKKK